MLGNITLDPAATSEQTTWDKAYNKLNLKVGLILCFQFLMTLFFIAWYVYDQHIPEYFATGVVHESAKHGGSGTGITILMALCNLTVGLPLYIFAKRAERKLGARPEAVKV